ncbi:MAG: hypothetical protein U0270_08395 [Labilithrix sp.]
MSDELDKSTGENGEEETGGAERPTVSPPFDPAAFARDVLAKPSPARGTPAASKPATPDAHTHATPPQGMAQQAAVLELARASTPPDPEAEKTTADRSVAPSPLAPPPLVPEEATPDSIRSIAAQKLPSHDVPRIEVPGPKKTESLSSFNAVDRGWVELEVATRPPPADAPDEDPILEVSHEPGGVVNLDLDDVDDHVNERPTAQRAKLPSLPEDAPATVAAPPVDPPPATAEKVPSKKPPAGEREMNDRVSVGDYSGALEIAEAILAEKPNDSAARACADSCRQVLRKMYAARIGPLDRVPSVAVARDQLRWLSIDHKAGFVLSLVDGVSSLEMIIDVSGMPELDTLRILSELAQQRIISLR